MKRRKKNIVSMIILLILLISAPFAGFAVDYNKIKHREKPVFCSNYGAYRDGGTVVCDYKFYQIIKWNEITRIHGKKNVQFRFGSHGTDLPAN